MAAVSGSVYVLRRHLCALLTRKVRPPPRAPGLGGRASGREGVGRGVEQHPIMCHDCQRPRVSPPVHAAHTPTLPAPASAPQSTGAVLGAIDSEGSLLRAGAIVAEQGVMAAWAGDDPPPFTLAEAGLAKTDSDAQRAAGEDADEGGSTKRGSSASGERGTGREAGAAAEAGGTDAEGGEGEGGRYGTRAQALLNALGSPLGSVAQWGPTTVSRAVAVLDRALLPHRATVRGPPRRATPQTRPALTRPPWSRRHTGARAVDAGAAAECRTPAAPGADLRVPDGQPPALLSQRHRCAVRSRCHPAS